MSTSDLLVLNHKVGAHAFCDREQSSTYEVNGTHVELYGGLCERFVSRDHVSFGANNGSGRIEARDQPLVELTDVDRILDAFPPKLDGFGGFGSGRANLTGAPSLVRTMIHQQLLDLLVFSLGFGDLVAHAMLGGVETAYSEAEFHCFPQQIDVWMAPGTGVQVGGKRVVGDLGRVGISNISRILGPGDQVDALADAVGADSHVLRCNDPGLVITLHLGDRFHVTLTKNDYVVPISDGQGWCLFVFLPSPDPVVLGLPFLRQVYTVLDFGSSERDERIGFAHAKPTERKEPHTSGSTTVVGG